MNETDRNNNDNPDPGQVSTYDPPSWITTDDLEAELFNAIVDDTFSIPGIEDDAYAEIDDHFGDDDDFEDEAEERRSILRLLGLLRPQLADLLGGPPAQ